MQHRPVELNIDGLVGPTHNYSGLSYGNIASLEHEQLPSNPKAAALQGLEKMRQLAALGIPQAIFPPHERPFLPILRLSGFYGTDGEILEKASKTAPHLLKAAYSSAFMWMANAATVSPSADSHDQRVHFTPANLISKFHRSFESPTSGMFLYRIFNHPAHFAHHLPLPFHPDFADEGGANHTRFCRTFDQPGIQLFVYGKSQHSQTFSPKKFPARQTEEAVQALVRLHRLNKEHVVIAQQHPDAIDAGVFHNDVISVGHQNVFFYHQKAFVDTANTIQQLKEKVETYCQTPFIGIEVKTDDLSLEEAVKTYLFNSQIVTLPDGTMALISPQECLQSSAVQEVLKQLLANTQQPIRQVLYQNLQESMQNGGGPACLRLRVVLTPKEFEFMNPHVLFTEALHEHLVAWVNKHYRDRLIFHDLSDPQLLQESRQALDELTTLLQIGPLYYFQQQEQTAKPPPHLPEKHP